MLNRESKMICHIVMFKLKDFAEGASKAENAEKMTKLLSELPALIPQIKKFAVGVDVLKSERSYDVALVGYYDNMADLDIYAKHPEHLRVVDFILKVRTESHSVDFEVDV